MNLSIRFLIGLASAQDVPSVRPADRVAFSSRLADARSSAALAILAGAYEGFTSWRGTGAWKGAFEPSLVVEIIVEDMSKDGGTYTGDDLKVQARSIAKRIASVLSQESVLLTFQAIEMESVGP